MVEPLQIAYYKGMGGKFGAIQLRPQLPHHFCKECKKKDYKLTRVTQETECWSCQSKGTVTSRDGAVFLEMCSTSGKNNYDWTKKIKFALSAKNLAEVAQVLEGRVESCSITHDPNGS